MAKDKQAKTDKKSKQGSADKGGGKGAKGDAGATDLSLAGHPRAVRGVARAKAWGGLGGFLLGGYLSLPTHTPLDAAFRALIAGVICYVAIWAAAVFLWRHLVVAELRHAEHELLAAKLAQLQPADPPTGPPIERRRAPVAS